jgi:uncharacterized protein YuzE
MTLARYHYDPAAGAAYVSISGERVAITKEVPATVNLDIDGDGHLVGIELLFFGDAIPTPPVPRAGQENVSTSIAPNVNYTLTTSLPPIGPWPVTESKPCTEGNLWHWSPALGAPCSYCGATP